MSKKQLSSPLGDDRNNNHRLEDDQEFQFLLAHLDDMSPLERAESVRTLINRGYTKREIARGLNVDEGTIRRDLEIAKLSDEHKDRIRAGESVASVLELTVAAPVAKAQVRQKDTTSFIEHVRQAARQQMQETLRVENEWAATTRRARRS